MAERWRTVLVGLALFATAAVQAQSAGAGETVRSRGNPILAASRSTIDVISGAFVNRVPG